MRERPSASQEKSPETPAYRPATGENGAARDMLRQLEQLRKDVTASKEQKTPNVPKEQDSPWDEFGASEEPSGEWGGAKKAA